MTSTQAAERQADHENLVRRSIEIIEQAYDDAGVRAIMGDFWCIDAYRLLADAKEQGYA